MKAISRALIYVGMFILLTAYPTAAQETQSQDADLIRTKIERFEQTDIGSKSSSVQSIYQRTLLRLYSQFNSALQQDIADLKAMQTAVGGTNSESQKEIALQIQNLLREQSEVQEKIQTLRGDLQTASRPVPAKPTTTVPTAEVTRVSFANPDTRTSMAASASNIPVSDRMSDINPAVPVSASSAAPVVFVPVIKGQIKLSSESLRGNRNIKSNLRDVASTGNPGASPIDLNNVRVIVRNSDGNVVADTRTTANGAYSITMPSIDAAGNYTVSTELDDENRKREVRLIDATQVQLDITVDDKPVSLLTRAVVGYEQTGASSITKTQKYFTELYISHPFPVRQKISPDFGERLRMWGNIRVTSVPQSSDAGVATFAAGFVQNASNVKVSEAAQVVDFAAGLEYRLFGNEGLLPSFDRQTKQKFSLSFIAGFGAVTPTSSRETLQVFKVFQDAPGLPAGLEGKEFVAFISSDRDRFFRQYFGGLRFQTFFFNQFNLPRQRHPAVLDVTYGQNEFATGGRFRGGVFRLDGYFPMPYEGLKYINLFGSALLKPSSSKIGVPLILEAAPAGVTVPAANVGLIAIPQVNRDYYRVGVGIDFISFIDAMKKLGDNK